LRQVFPRQLPPEARPTVKYVTDLHFEA
jgi:hypothetical protein